MAPFDIFQHGIWEFVEELTLRYIVPEEDAKICMCKSCIVLEVS